MNVINATNVKHAYISDTGKHYALNGITLRVNKGDFVCVLGHNGSGKSTFAKHINVLLQTQEGELLVCGYDTKDEANLIDIRTRAGMVFQNPDNQIVSTIVEEDVAFGPENLGVPPLEIQQRVKEALSTVNMTGNEKKAPHMLSGGQKQRIAIAGVLAMHPELIVFDEPTAMLDPRGRQEVMETITKLNKQGKTIVLITHFMEEAQKADKVFIMSKGVITAEGTPKEVFSKGEILESSGLTPPMPVYVYEGLKQRGITLESCPVDEEELLAEVKKLHHHKTGNIFFKDDDVADKNLLLSLKDVNYTYMPNTPFCVQALKNINLDVYEGELLGVIGHTGCGKSTLIQIIAGLINQDNGIVALDGKDINAKEYDRKELRRKVGVVFQFPEYQLFEETVGKDVAFGPQKAGMENIEELVRDALNLVGFDYEEIKDLSPFDLSGGQKRKIAIAGVLATSPKLLILDEPISGLDPRARESFMQLVCTLNKKGTTIIMISHNMEGLCAYAHKIIALNKGEIVLNGKTREIFSNYQKLEEIGLLSSEANQFCQKLNKNGIYAPNDIINTDELIDFLTDSYGEKLC